MLIRIVISGRGKRTVMLKFGRAPNGYRLVHVGERAKHFLFTADSHIGAPPTFRLNFVYPPASAFDVPDAQKSRRAVDVHRAVPAIL
jgi:hypothetical protein